MSIEDINKEIALLSDTGNISDGFHTFDELYYHRMILFATICNMKKQISWKSKFHQDGSMLPGIFIAGITTPKGNFTYHYKLEHWGKFDVKELESAPKWDGHTAKDIVCLMELI